MEPEVSEKKPNRVLRAAKAVGNLFGFTHHSKYQNDFIAKSNVRSGVFMGFIIVVLEACFFFRQIFKYVIPGMESWNQPYNIVLYYTSNFILFFLIGLSIGVYSLTRQSNKISKKKDLALNLGFGGAALLFCIYGFFEPYSEFDTQRHIVANVTMILLYLSAAFTAGAVIVDTLLRYFRPKERIWLSNVVLMLFALMCFVFGIKVSFSDYTSTSITVIDGIRFVNQKQMLCFLTMVVYGSCLLIWRPYLTIVTNGLLFLFFYLLMTSVPTEGFYSLDTVLESGSRPMGLPFNEGDLINYITFLVSLTAICVSIYHQRLNEAKKSENLEYLAHFDKMTGLTNYATFCAEISDALAENPSLSSSKLLIFTNIESFKTFNERRGFEGGNEFLKEVGQILKSSFEGDPLCRQGDDHFLFYSDKEGIEERLSSLSEKIREKDRELGLVMKFGSYELKEGEDIFAAADKARYACNQLKTDHSKIHLEFDEGMAARYRLLHHIINSLDKAIDENWIVPYYQPVVWSESKELCGAEALARWIDPELGMISPGTFITVLEANKLVYKVDAHILRLVCRDLRRHIDEGKKAIPVSVNFSRCDFSMLDVAALLDSTLAEFNIDKSLIHVEVTESALGDSESRLGSTLDRLKANGYSIWLDDFGSGYSSLNVLKDYHFDVMKIDLKFLEGFDSNELAKPLLDSVITMAGKLGMRTLCEGVETQNEERYLTSVGCERLQGWLFGKAVPLEEFDKMIEEGAFVVSANLL